ncbi:GNAT family N-acetyltransferase [Croceimicrobium hydrocarbonivorans]|uniref:GNAT family N-acetyltransferase n=1 Tax=Croceimicrobium hydrocarbonivorans TaxID=2761580 RepID=A0A7H0VBI7_9FLAO|nr:GNAT family N-acetyltransferase [Croceimicrobium hydrocarbonivorans]QNR23085.1 GNAT family N-acetyltransferase [Croceimicrobium hydrocarbonivorans]
MLSTKRAYLRPLESSDFELLLEMYLEPDSNKYIAPLKDRSPEFYLIFLQTKQQQNQKEMGFWVAVEKASDQIIGTVNLNTYAPLAITHIGCHLRSAFWGKSYATELLSTMIKYGFEERDLPCIHGVFERDNLASRRLMKKLGFSFYRKEFVNEVPLEVYRLTIDEYQSS